MLLKKNNNFFVILKIYLLALSIFFVFRLLLFFIEQDRIQEGNYTAENILTAFMLGIRFDVVIIGYIMAVPTLLLLLQELLGRTIKIVNIFIFYWTFLLFSIAFLISSADIPYFSQFFSRFNVGAFEWLDSPLFIFKMIIQEPKYFVFIIVYVLLIYLFYKGLRKILEGSKPSNLRLWQKSTLSVAVLLLVFIGIRGRIEKKSPIRIGTAYFCNDQFLNQIGLNPSFTFIRSYLDFLKNENKTIKLIDPVIAIENVQHYLKIDSTIGNSPIAREVVPNQIRRESPNIVLIMMESMSAAKMKRHGNKDNLTPFLDSLLEHGYYFERTYTAGEHTFNGIFSTQFSFPALYRQHSMKNIKKFDGISTVLKKLGYSTTFFLTHDSQFDNTEGFLRANDFDKVIGESFYPPEEVKTTLGVPDDYMFRFAIPKINEMHKTNIPFFVSFMTASDHGPYYIPPYFKPKSSTIKKQSVEYADWSIKQFMKEASKTEWFDNTIFVLIADHGSAMNVKYDISLNYHHTPLIIYSPKLIEPKVFTNISGQIDVFPTIMGILNKKYINNTLGIDLLKEKRPYIIINGDDKVAALDSDFLFVLKGEDKKLFRYGIGEVENCIEQYPQKALEMEIYLKSNLQTYQEMLLKDQTHLEVD